MACSRQAAVSEPVSEEDQMILRFAEPASPNNPLAQISKYFVNLVQAKSNGRICIKMYYDGKLGNNTEVLKQIQFGGIAMGRVNLCDFAAVPSQFQSDISSLAFKPYTQVEHYMADKKDDIAFDLQKEKLTLLGTLPPSKRCVYSDKVPLTCFDDLKDLTLGIDSNELYRTILIKAGLHPVFMGNAETYPSLQNGYIDAREDSLTVLMTSQAYACMHNVLIVDGIAFPSCLVASSEILQHLDSADKQLLRECAEEANEFGKELLASFLSTARQRLSEDKNLKEISIRM